LIFAADVSIVDILVVHRDSIRAISFCSLAFFFLFPLFLSSVLFFLFFRIYSLFAFLVSGPSILYSMEANMQIPYKCCYFNSSVICPVNCLSGCEKLFL